ncbi:MAG: hypothetical protein M3179_08275 [Actinomycetota bacterium]|nr:hypothetical protein [Actinomycetota bacterium]
MRQRARLAFAGLLVVSLVGAFGATRSLSPTDAVPSMSDGTVAVGARLLASEVAALRNHLSGTGERWLQQSTSSKGRSLSLAATLAVALGALSLLPRLQGRRLRVNSSTLTLRRHSVALRAPPSTSLA